MSYFDVVRQQLFKFENLGKEVTLSGAVLIGHAPHIAPMAWLHSIYPVLTEEDIIELEAELKKPIPEAYRDFLKNYSNGLALFTTTLTFYGMRKVLGRTIEASRQPFAIGTSNNYERPKNSKNSYFFIGGYDWDGSKLYIDSDTNKVYYCDRRDATPLMEWESFEAMLTSEVSRLIRLHDENGIKKDEDQHTTPVKTG
jgi:hypothetical protein